MTFDKQKTENLKNLHWGQRKLLLSEIEFLTNYWNEYDQNLKKYVLYVGAAPGEHIKHLIKLFPTIHFILYDPAPFTIKPSDNVTIHQEYFTDEDVQKYKNMNLFFISDIREREVGKYKLDDPTKFNEKIKEEMALQKKHIHFSQLKPYIEEHPTTEFMLFHFSQRYKDTDIVGFFEKLGIKNLHWWVGLI